AFTFDTSGQLVMQTAIGGRGTLFGPLVGAAVWLFLQDFLQAPLGLGAVWKLVLGVVFVLLVCFLRRGIIGGIGNPYDFAIGRHFVAKPKDGEQPASATDKPPATMTSQTAAPPMPATPHAGANAAGPILQTKGLTKRYGGLLANSDIEFT